MKAPRILLILGILLVVLGLSAIYLSRDTEKAPVDGPTAPVDMQASGQVLDPMPGWKTYSDDALSFRHPLQLSTKYIRALRWPPLVSISEVRCETGERGEARLTGINGHTYCVFISQEGAAGSIYTNYFYVTEKDNRSITLDLTLQAPQCANYDDPQKTECERERESFNVDDLADRILQSVDVRTLP